MAILYISSIFISNPRLSYVLDFVLKKSLGLDWEFLDDSSIHKQRKPWISYGDAPLRSPFLHLDAIDISLWDNPVVLTGKSEKGLPSFILHEKKSGEYQCDPLAQIFWALSRCEEYSPANIDSHGRFMAQFSKISQMDLLERPWVDEWVGELGERIKKAFPEINIPQKAYQAHVTFDIDYAWAYQNKGFLRNLGGLLKSISKGERSEAARRLGVWLGGKKDPFDTFDLIEKMLAESKVQTRFFYLLADRGPFDKNISYRNVAFQKLIKKLTQQYPFGIHPSYQSNQKSDMLGTEIKRLEGITGQKASHSRQHFLKLSFPDTYRRLIQAGITDDYSMGYAELPGFRAGTSMPFHWYDLEEEQCTNLTIHPFCWMDVTFNTYLKTTPAEALAKSAELQAAVKKVGGDFYAIWHNNSLCREREWAGWGERLL